MKTVSYIISGIVLIFKLFLIVDFRCGLFEISDPLANACSNLWEFAGAKNNEDDNKYDDQFRHAYSKHYTLLTPSGALS